MFIIFLFISNTLLRNKDIKSIGANIVFKFSLFFSVRLYFIISPSALKMWTLLKLKEKPKGLDTELERSLTGKKLMSD